MVALGLLFAFVLSLSTVQTQFAKRITENVNNRFDTDISIKKASISLNGDVLISDILVHDHRKDTLLFVRELKTSLNGLDRFLKRNYDFESINLGGAKLFLTSRCSSVSIYTSSNIHTASRLRVPNYFKPLVVVLCLYILHPT